MGSWRRPLVLASTGGTVLAASVALTRVFATRDIFFDVAVLAVVVAALVGLYALRRRAREVLVYDRGAPNRVPAPPTLDPTNPRSAQRLGGLTRRFWW